MTEQEGGARRAGNGQPDRRLKPRWKVFEFANIRTDSGDIGCLLDDLSLTGALISVGAALIPGQDIFVILDNDFAIPATVVHNRGSLTGVRFNMDRDDTARFAKWLNALDKE